MKLKLIRQLNRYTLLMTGLLLGLVLSYLLSPQFTQMSPKDEANTGSEQLDPYQFMRHSQHLLRRTEIIEPLICAKLASDLSIEIDATKLHQGLEKQLAPFNQDKDKQQGRYLLIYLKGYAYGLVHGLDDKEGIFNALKCQRWLEESEAIKLLI
ncbi:hypothetical protein LZP69_00670 [Shewanella sp. AS1]|uniref:hypothetical protein n=1 Tax=Shewanella sp. AS1 TaxID=2907626 RepID=UPI001F344D18|nr:hypothetical protein [Shewanella sp. AS1]MCE9677702.1 hypothetical protein [Shewanella sp. AS1]